MTQNGGTDIKAVIMAGGEGLRLRPLSNDIPKPMVRLLDRPVMEYIVSLLKRHDLRDIIATTQFLPQKISGYFGDGGRFGVRMSYSIEETPLGTAGSVRRCAEFIDGEDFLVISGDGVCDIDLTRCIAFHKEKNADATLVLYSSGTPLEYGLVMTDRGGRVERFIEKPSWGQVFTDSVNTGIYILKTSVLRMIPEKTKFDFARDLFPMLLGGGAKVCGITAEGYWCDMGDIRSYLRCSFAALAGEVRLEIPAPEVSPGIWSASRRDFGATLIAPCYIGEDVTIGRGSVIGPNAVIGSGSHVGEGASVARSVLDGAYAGPGSNISGAVLCKGSRVKGGASMSENSALGCGAVVGEMASVSAGVRIWPSKSIAPGMRLEHSVTQAEVCRSWVFDDFGVVSGEPNIDLTPEFLMHLGMALADWAGGETALSRRGESASRVCGMALETGMLAAGGAVVRCDAAFPSVASFAAKGCGVSASVFVEQSGGKITVHIFNRDGLPPSRESIRKIEGSVLRCEYPRAEPGMTGLSRTVSGVGGAYAAAAASASRLPEALPLSGKRLRVSAPGSEPAGDALRSVLSQCGCRLHSGTGTPVFQLSGDGFSLSAVDETGHALSFDQLLAVMALLDFDSGAKMIAVPYDAPKAIDMIAEGYAAKVLRVGRDGVEANRLFAASEHMRDGLFAAARIVGAMSRMGASLSDLRQTIPAFRTVSREIGVSGDRGLVMRMLADGVPGDSRELFEGLRISTPTGWVHISPHFSRPSLRIVGEGADMEMAEELCGIFEKQAKEIESSISPR